MNVQFSMNLVFQHYHFEDDQVVGKKYIDDCLYKHYVKEISSYASKEIFLKKIKAYIFLCLPTSATGERSFSKL